MKKRKFGFTLFEVLIYIAVLIILLLSIFSILIWVLRFTTKAKATREVLDNLKRATEVMSYEIREAKSIYWPTTTSSQISLESNHYLPEDENSTFLDFYLCQKRLCLKKESQPPIILTSDNVEIKRLEFFQISTTTPSIQFTLEMSYKNPNNRPELNISVVATSTVSLRNY